MKDFLINISYYLRLHYISVAWYKLLYYLFSFELSDEPIPRGTRYCYVLDVERNNTEPLDPLSYWTKTCKYYKAMPGQLHAACTFSRYAGHDVLLGDQCKICDID